MTKKRRILSVIMAVALVASMMFAMTANTFAATDETITVTVKLDTRSYDLSPALKDKNNNLLGGTQVTYSNVTLPAGSTVWDAVQKVAADNNFELQYKTVADYYDSSITHYAVQDIAQVGENTIENAGTKSAFITTASPYDERGYYYESGWVYGLTPAGSTEFFPGNYMDAVEIVDGETITLHYSTTGCIDVNTGTWTADYSNPDVTMWNLYDQLAALDPDDELGALGYVTDTIKEGSTVATGNTTGLTAYYFSHNGLTDENEGQFIPYLQEVLAMFE